MRSGFVHSKKTVPYTFFEVFYFCLRSKIDRLFMFVNQDLNSNYRGFTSANMFKTKPFFFFTNFSKHLEF